MTKLEKQIISSIKEAFIDLDNQDKVLIEAMANLLTYRNTYRGDMSNSIRRRLIRILKDNTINGDGTDWIDIYKETL